MMDRVIFLVHGVRGVWLNMFHVFLADPLCFCPVGLGVGCLNLCNFWILPVRHFLCWLVCFWLGLGFSRPVSF